MFFPGSRPIPGPGDRVLVRELGAMYNPQALTVIARSSDNCWLHLTDRDAPVPIGSVAWWPEVGDQVYLLIQPYLSWLEAILAEFVEHRLEDPILMDVKIRQIKEKIRGAAVHRVGELLSVENRWAEVQFGPDRTEKVPFCCVAVEKKSIKGK